MRLNEAGIAGEMRSSLGTNSTVALNALAVVDDPTEAKRDLDRVTTPKKDAAGTALPRFQSSRSSRCRIISGRSWMGGISSEEESTLQSQTPEAILLGRRS
jgi:hypothetical protein